MNVLGVQQQGEGSALREALGTASCALIVSPKPDHRSPQALC